MTWAQEIGKINQCDECKQERTIASAALHGERGWIKICFECLPKSLGISFIQETREMVFKPEEFCEKHNRPKKLWKQGKSGKLEAHCFDCDNEEWIKSLEHLHSEPLKIAKFFYKKGEDTWPTIQRLVYLAYIQSLKQKKVLFEEKFEKWEGNPMLISLYEKSTSGIYPLLPATVLKNIEEPAEPFVRNLLADVYRNYACYEDEERVVKLIVDEIFQPLINNNGARKDDPNSFYRDIHSRQVLEKKEYLFSYAS